MKIKITLLFIAMITFLTGYSQGKVMTKQVIKSTILNRDVNYTVYLPEGYETNQRNYPVTYLLHGYGDSDDGWIQFGEINRLADAAIKQGKIAPMIIVTPDGFI